MFWINVKRILRTGFFSFSRNAFVSLAGVLVMIVTLSVIASLLFLSAVLNTTLDSLRNKVDVNVYFVTGAKEDSILSMQERLEALPEVKSVTYISREQALEDFKKRHENDQFTIQALEELGENPLGASLNIKAKDPSQYGGISSFLEAQDSQGEQSIIDKINYFQNKEAIDRLSQIIGSSERLGTIIALVLAVISILITFNTIRLAIYISREEISVMRLVGADSSYVRGPFIIVGMLYGVVAALFTLLIFYPLTYWLGNSTENFFIGLNLFNYYTNHFGQIFLLVMGSGIIIGVISSYLAVRKYLKV